MILLNISEFLKNSISSASNSLQKSNQAIKDTAKKEQYKHDWIVATVSIIGGGIMGFIASILFWLLTK